MKKIDKPSNKKVFIAAGYEVRIAVTRKSEDGMVEYPRLQERVIYPSERKIRITVEEVKHGG